MIFTLNFFLSLLLKRQFFVVYFYIIFIFTCPIPFMRRISLFDCVIFFWLDFVEPLLFLVFTLLNNHFFLLFYTGFSSLFLTLFSFLLILTIFLLYASFVVIIRLNFTMYCIFNLLKLRFKSCYLLFSVFYQVLREKMFFCNVFATITLFIINQI